MKISFILTSLVLSLAIRPGTLEAEVAPLPLPAAGACEEPTILEDPMAPVALSHCTAHANCEYGSDATCSGSCPADSQDQNCSLGQAGWAECGGVKTFCQFGCSDCHCTVGQDWMCPSGKTCQRTLCTGNPTYNGQCL